MTPRPGNLRIRFLMVLVGHRYPATVVIGAALFLGGCATPRTVATAQTPEPIVERVARIDGRRGASVLSVAVMSTLYGRGV